MGIRRKRGIYEKYIKRILDIICALMAIIAFGWVYIIVAVLVRINLGKPVVFRQPRPGIIDSKTGKEKIFYMYKFRSMSDKIDENGDLLPDEQRLGKFGRILRNTSLDELLEVFNILKGDMSFIGPRPQLVRDLVFMTDEQRMRHTAKPGLSGLAQIEGRNAISWDEKFEWDLRYIDNVSFISDIKIIYKTVIKVFGHKETAVELNVTYDYGDWLLINNRITREEYNVHQNEAKYILEKIKL